MSTLAQLEHALSVCPVGRELVYFRTRALVACVLHYGCALRSVLKLELAELVEVTPVRGRWKLQRSLSLGRLGVTAHRALREYLAVAMALELIDAPRGLVFRNRFGGPLSMRNAQLDLDSFGAQWTYRAIAACVRDQRRELMQRRKRDARVHAAKLREVLRARRDDGQSAGDVARTPHNAPMPEARLKTSIDGQA